MKIFRLSMIALTLLAIGCSSSSSSSSPAGPDTTKASLSLEFSDVTYEYTDMHYYIHTRTFTETNGVGVTLTSGQACYESSGTCDSASVNYRIDGNNELVQNNKQFFTTFSSEKYTLKYWGSDDNGNDVYIEQIMTVEEATHNP